MTTTPSRAPSARLGACDPCADGDHGGCDGVHAHGDCTCYDDAWEWHEAHEQGTFVLEPITLKKGLTGAKPPKVCDWILDLLNVLPGDTLDDLYPGTRVMSERAALRLDEATRETP